MTSAAHRSFAFISNPSVARRTVLFKMRPSLSTSRSPPMRWALISYFRTASLMNQSASPRAPATKMSSPRTDA
eukprot:6218724-Lingulodinium_polyedra.AAC.1